MLSCNFSPKKIAILGFPTIGGNDAVPCMAFWPISTRQLLSVFSSNLNLRKWGSHGETAWKCPK